MAEPTDREGTGPAGSSRNPRAFARLSWIRIRKLARLTSNPGYWPALKSGVAASVEHSRIPFRPDIRTVLDVGASRGQFALFALQRFPGAMVICFEPLPGPLADLKGVLGDSVETVESAVGAEPGRATINVSTRDDSSSLLPIGRRQVEEFPGTGAADSLEVEVTTLDRALADPPARPCLLKIDVQGLELEVLKGAGRTLEAVDEALIECSFVELYEGQAMADEVVAFLLERGLRLAGVHEVAYSSEGRAIQADFHFRREAG